MAAVISDATLDNIQGRHPLSKSWLDTQVTYKVPDDKKPPEIARTFENDVVSTGNWTKCLIICTKYIGHLVSPKDAAQPIPESSIAICENGQVAYISTTESSNGTSQTHCLWNGTHDDKLIMHKSGRYGDGCTLDVMDLGFFYAGTGFLGVSGSWGRSMGFNLYSKVEGKARKRELGALVFTWKYVVLDGKKSLLMEAGANDNKKQLARVERKGNRGHGSARWADKSTNTMELWMDSGEMGAAGISEAAVVASCLMILRSEVIRRYSIAAWLLGMDEDDLGRVRIE